LLAQAVDLLQGGEGRAVKELRSVEIGAGDSGVRPRGAGRDDLGDRFSAFGRLLDNLRRKARHARIVVEGGIQHGGITGVRLDLNAQPRGSLAKRRQRDAFEHRSLRSAL
jgi:hypothetical protein